MEGHILVAGCGFLGSWFTRFYAQRAEALNYRATVICLDNDKFEMRNTPTQYLDRSLVGVEKAMIACDTLSKFNIPSRPAIQRLTGENVTGFIEEYGPFSRLLLNGWGIRSTLDFGRLVFNLVESGLMRKQETDSIEDFSEVYDFETVFDEPYDWLSQIRGDLGLAAPKPDPSL